MWSILLIALTTAGALVALWWDFIIKKENKSLIKEILSTFFILAISVANYYQSEVDKRDRLSEKEADSLRHKIQYDSIIANNQETRRAAEAANKSLAYLYNTSEKEKIGALDNFDKHLIQTFNAIQRRSENLFFPTIDSLDLLAKMDESIKEISDLIETVRNNPILNSNPIVLKYYKELDNSITALRLPISGYGLESIHEVYGQLYHSLVKFVRSNGIYNHRRRTYRFHKFQKVDSLIIKEINALGS